jgi:hypothetical protein
MTINSPNHSHHTINQDNANLSEQEPNSPASRLKELYLGFKTGEIFEEIEKNRRQSVPNAAYSDFLLSFALEQDPISLLESSNAKFIAAQPQSDAFFKDISRVARIKGINDPENELPAASNNEFEDPYHLGGKFLQKISQMNLQTALTAKSVKEAANNETPNPSINTGESPEADFLIAHILSSNILTGKIPPHAYRYIWEKYNNIFISHLSAGTLVELAITFAPHFDNQMKNTFIRSLIPCLTRNGNYVFLPHLWLFYGKFFTNDINTNTALINCLINLFKSDNENQVGFAFYVLISHVDFYDLVGKLYSTHGDWQNPALADRLKTYLNTTGITLNEKKLTETLIRNFDEILYKFITDKGYLNFENLIKDIAVEFPIFEFFDKELAKEIIRNKITPDEPNEQYFTNVSSIKLPDDFEAANSVLDMLTNTSLPLLERRHLVDKDLMPKRYVVVIEPNPNTSKRLASFRMHICLYTLKKDRISSQCATFDFEQGSLVNSMPSLNEKQFEIQKKQLEKLGIYLAHQYFVRKSTDVKPQEEPPPQVEEPISVEPEPPSEPQPPPSEPSEPAPSNPRKFTERAQEPLKIDLRDCERKKLIDVQKKISNSLRANKQAVLKLLDGDTNGINPDNIILHRETVRIYDDKEYKVFERVPAIEILDAAIEGTLAEKGWYLLDKLPHMKALGYRKYRHEVKNTGCLTIQELEKSNLPQEILPAIWQIDKHRQLAKFKDGTAAELQQRLKNLPLIDSEERTVTELWNKSISPENNLCIWSVSRNRASRKARLAYSEYSSSGLPPLSEFREFQASIYILAEADRQVQDIEVKYDDVSFKAKQIKQNASACLVDKINKDPNWLDQWIASQKRVYEEEIGDILASSLPTTNKETSVAEIQKKIQSLPDLAERIRANTNYIYTKTAVGIQRDVRLALGWVMTETSFNQGCFISLKELKNGENQA